MTRREFGAAALASAFTLRAQQAARSNYGTRYNIPASPLARWNFHRLGEGLSPLQDLTPITSVSDDSGNGYTLTPYTGVTPQIPLFTTRAINGRGGFWAGSNQPTNGSVNSDSVRITEATTAVNVATGSLTLVAPSGLAIFPGQPLFMFPVSNGTATSPNMTGTVTSYSGTSLVVSIASVVGTGTGITGWSISIYLASSTSANSIGTGSNVTFTIQSGISTIRAGMVITAWSTAQPALNWMSGTVVSYTGTTLVMLPVTSIGSGTGIIAWTFGSSPQSVPYGALATPVGSLISWAETPLTVLICAQLGNMGNPNNSSSMMQVGNVTYSQRGINSNWPKKYAIWNATSGHGDPNYAGNTGSSSSTANPAHAGTTCMAFVNGFGGIATQTRIQIGSSTRYTDTSLNWNAGSVGGSGTAQVVIGYNTFAGAFAPDGCIYHEVVVYSRALTDAELDQWGVYCNQMYGAPLYIYNGGTGVNQQETYNVVDIGDSVTDCQNAVLGYCWANRVQLYMGKQPKVRMINYGVGSATYAAHNANIAYYTAMYDSTLPAGHNIAIVHGGGNDYAAGRTYQDTYDGTGGTPSTSLANLVSTLKTTGFKVIVMTAVSGFGSSSPAITWIANFNALVIANTIAADAIVNTTSSGPSAGILQAYWANERTLNSHGSSICYDLWANDIYPVLSPLIV